MPYFYLKKRPPTEESIQLPEGQSVFEALGAENALFLPKKTPAPNTPRNRFGDLGRPEHPERKI